jgi:mannose-1-phosphate guanylyltransferase/mannose-6-phosphate isomerase
MVALDGAEAPLVVTGASHAAEVRRQLDAVGVGGEILTEPMGRDSGPAMVAAALWIARRSPRAVIVAVASDHHIPDAEAFAAGVSTAMAAAADGAIVTFGVQPRHAATAFGYIRPGGPYPGESRVLRVEGFEEKPDAVRADRLIAEGCLWNSGNFMVRVDTLLDEARAHAPGLVEAVAAAMPHEAPPGGLAPLGAAFADVPRVSFDVGVMEKTSRAAVLAIDYAWSDLGSWDAIWSASVRDSTGNVVSGEASLTQASDCLIRAEGGARVVGLGLRGLAVVARGKDVLVADLGRAWDVKSGLEDLRRAQAVTAAAADPHAVLAAAAGRLVDWLTMAALPLWWCFGADHRRGGFHEGLGSTLTPSRAPRRSRVQARQVFVYATAGAMGWPGPWIAAVRHGLEALEARFVRSDGLFRSTVTVDGDPLDDRAQLYDQAFVLLALAAATRSEADDPAARTAQARALMAAIRGGFAHPAAGFRAEAARETFLTDPLMHLLEAAIAWSELDLDGPWAGVAAEIVALFAEHLFDHAGDRIYEVYDAAWRPLSPAGDDRIEPGHQFEWAWLLDRWARMSGDPAADEAARRIYQTGKRSVDRSTGLVVDALHDDLSVARGTSRLWPQTERLKAALSLETAPIARAREAGAAAIALESYLTPSPAGLWRDAPAGAQGHAAAVSPASSFYHIIGALSELETARARWGAEAPTGVEGRSRLRV